MCIRICLSLYTCTHVLYVLYMHKESLESYRIQEAFGNGIRGTRKGEHLLLISLYALDT